MKTVCAGNAINWPRLKNKVGLPGPVYLLCGMAQDT